MQTLSNPCYLAKLNKTKQQIVNNLSENFNTICYLIKLYFFQLSACPWAGCFPFLGLSFLVCKNKTLSTQSCEDRTVNAIKTYLSHKEPIFPLQLLKFAVVPASEGPHLSMPHERKRVSDCDMLNLQVHSLINSQHISTIQLQEQIHSDII